MGIYFEWKSLKKMHPIKINKHLQNIITINGIMNFPDIDQPKYKFHDYEYFQIYCSEFVIKHFKTTKQNRLDSNQKAFAWKRNDECNKTSMCRPKWREVNLVQEKLLISNEGISKFCVRKLNDKCLLLLNFITVLHITKTPFSPPCQKCCVPSQFQNNGNLFHSSQSQIFLYRQTIPFHIITIL